MRTHAAMYRLRDALVVEPPSTGEIVAAPINSSSSQTGALYRPGRKTTPRAAVCRPPSALSTRPATPRTCPHPQHHQQSVIGLLRAPTLASPRRHHPVRDGPASCGVDQATAGRSRDQPVTCTTWSSTHPFWALQAREYPLAKLAVTSTRDDIDNGLVIPQSSATRGREPRRHVNGFAGRFREPGRPCRASTVLYTFSST